MALPQVGIDLVLNEKDYAGKDTKYINSLRKMNAETEKAARAIDQNLRKIAEKSAGSVASLEQQIRRLGTSFDHLRQRAQSFAQTGVSPQQFQTLSQSLERLQNRFMDITESFGLRTKDILPEGRERIFSAFDELGRKVAAARNEISALPPEAERTTSALTQMRQVLSTVSVATGIFALTIGTLINQVKASVDAFLEMTSEIRRIKVIMGTTTTEAAAWSKFAQDSGVSASVFERALIQLERGMVDYYTAQLQGKESTSSFSRALETLKIKVENADGSLRTASDVMRDIVVGIQGMDSNGAKAGLTVQVFGRYNKDLAVAIIDAARSMEESERIAKRLGATITDEDVKAMVELRLATSDMKTAFRSWRAEIGANATPVLIILANVATEAAVKMRELFIAASALAQMGAYIAGGLDPALAVAKTAEYVANAKDKFEELRTAQERFEIGVENAIFNEELRQQEIQQTIQSLDDLKRAFNDQMEDMRIQWGRAWDDMARSRIRETIERAMREAWEEADMIKDFFERMADIQKSYNRKVEDIRRDQEQKRDDFQRDANKKREKLEKDHQDRLLKIRNAYYDALEEAVRQNDAVAVLRAMRERNRALRDERQRYRREQDDLEDSLDERRQEIKEDFERRLEDARIARDRQIADAQEGYARQQADLEESRRRQRIIREMHYRWEEEDLRRSQSRQEADAKRSYQRQQTDLQTHLNNLQRMSVQNVQQTGQALATATANGIAAVGQAAVSEARSWAKRLLVTTSEGMSGNSYSGQFGGGVVGGGRLYRDAGGIDIANKPTPVMVAGSGPEALISVPIPRGQMSIDHKFSPLPINLSGAGGMAAPQVQSLVEAALMDLARQLATHVVRR